MTCENHKDLQNGAVCVACGGIAKTRALGPSTLRRDTLSRSIPITVDTALMRKQLQPLILAMDMATLELRTLAHSNQILKAYVSEPKTEKTPITYGGRSSKPYLKKGKGR